MRAGLLAERQKLRNAYCFHRNSARQRGIDFKLTFDEWLDFWKQSGHLHERGRKKDQYVMARHNDLGPYAVGNVSIITGTENRMTRRTEAKIIRAQRVKPINPYAQRLRRSQTAVLLNCSVAHLYVLEERNLLTPMREPGGRLGGKPRVYYNVREVNALCIPNQREG